MEPIEIELKNALARSNPIPAAELAALNSRVIQSFSRKQKAVGRLMSVYLVVLAAGMLGLLALYLNTTDLRFCLLYGIAILMLSEGTVLIKLWYWIVHSRIATVREIKLLQLAVAETRNRPVLAQPSTATPELEKICPATSSMKAIWSKAWRVLAATVWLLALAGLVCSAWWIHSREARSVPSHFEFQKTIGSADASPMKEWQEVFEVTSPHRHFYAWVQAQDAGAKVWLSCGAEGNEPMFTGWVAGGSMNITESHFWFGIPTPGHYIVKAKAEGAPHGYTVRIGGVEEVAGLTPMRILPLMISVAVIVVIPLLWLQDRWLRWADPELVSSRD
jgi:hypothetical protein